MIGNSAGVKSHRRGCQLNGDLMPNSRQNAFQLIFSSAFPLLDILYVHLLQNEFTISFLRLIYKHEKRVGIIFECNSD